MKKYEASFKVNNGSLYGTFYYDDLKEAKKSIQEICKGNVFTGSCGFWSISETGKDETLYAGKVKGR